MTCAIFYLQEKSRFELYIQLIEVLIWPLTLLIIILIFKNTFKSAFKRLGSFEANATGISMTFQELADEAIELAEGVKPLAIAKSGVSLHSHSVNHNSTPFEQVAEIQHELNLGLSSLIKHTNVQISNASNILLARMLEKEGVITYKHYKLVEAIEKLISLSGKNITQTQVNDIKNLKNAIIKTS